MNVPALILAKAMIKWPNISGKTRVMVTSQEVLIIPVMKENAPGYISWRYEGDTPEYEEYTLLRLTPEPFIDNWDAAYDPDEDIAVFRCRDG